MSQAGRLFYVVGASGAGKDSLMRLARERLASRPVVFAHRYITRPVELEGENHVQLTEAEFEVRRQHGLFAMQWDSHGLRYGIGREIDAWRASGLDVVVNGSRAYLESLRQDYPDAMVVCVDAPEAVLRERLEQRGRESGAEIEKRLQRAAAFRAQGVPGMVWIDNGGALEAAGDAFVELLESH